MHLIRDGRGVLHSNLKKKYTVNFKDEKTGKIRKKIYNRNANITPLQTINSWKKGIIKSTLLLKLFRRKNSLLVKYEDFTNSPEIVLSRILKFANIIFEESMLQLEKGEKHIVCGNPSRINATQIHKLSKGWRKMDKDLIKLFNKKGAWLNRILGY